MQLFLIKNISGIAINEGPDQTAPFRAVWSRSALFAYAILSEILVYKILRHLRYAILWEMLKCWVMKV